MDRALAAQRESRRIVIRKAAGIDSLLRDIAAIANSGGGAVVLRESALTLDAILAAMRRHGDFADLQLHGGVLVVGEAVSPIAIEGVVYIRRGTRTARATSDDLSKLIDRRISMVRKAWLSAIRHVVQPDAPYAEATSVRVVSDPRAPAFRLVDYDKTHPFRQKEVLAVLRDRMPGLTITQFDLLAMRKVHDIDARPEFVHKPAFGSNQYSVAFVDWLQQRIGSDPGFIAAAREQYIRSRRSLGA